MSKYSIRNVYSATIRHSRGNKSASELARQAHQKLQAVGLSIDAGAEMALKNFQSQNRSSTDVLTSPSRRRNSANDSGRLGFPKGAGSPRWSKKPNKSTGNRFPLGELPLRESSTDSVAGEPSGVHVAPTAGQPVYFKRDNIKASLTPLNINEEEESEPRAIQMRDIEKAIREIDKVQN